MRWHDERLAVLVDFTSPSREALRLALSWLPRLGLSDDGAWLDVLHFGWPQLPDEPEPLVARKLARIESEITRVKAGLHEPPHTIRPRNVMGDEVVEGAVAEARAHGYQMIVLGTHGGGAVSRALIGSVALGLMHTAPCPVLVVPPPRR